MKYCRAIASLVSTLSSQPSTPTHPLLRSQSRPPTLPLSKTIESYLRTWWALRTTLLVDYYYSRSLHPTTTHCNYTQQRTTGIFAGTFNHINREGERHGTASERRTNEQDSNGGGWLYWLAAGVAREWKKNRFYRHMHRRVFEGGSSCLRYKSQIHFLLICLPVRSSCRFFYLLNLI